jgi:hypothetical protein
MLCIWHPSTRGANVFGGTAPGTHRSYSTTFPRTENPISEGGKWINGQAAGLDWADVRTASGFAFGAEIGGVRPEPQKYDDSTALLTGAWGPDQMAQATVRALNPQNDKIYQEVELRLRSTLSPHKATGYEICFRLSKSAKAYTQIVRWNGPLGSFTYLNTANGSQYGVANADVVKATIIGNVITVYINRVQVLQATDSTYKNGSPGMGFYLEGTSGVNRDYGFASFTASDGLSGSKEQTINPERAAQYFMEAEALSRQDAGRLWGVPIYGPMILVDPETHQAAANQADAERRLSQSGNVFVGKLPTNVMVANTALDWAGVHWTMIMWPLPEDPDRRARLMMHECFHRVQDKLGLPAGSPINAHLESRDGRIWLLLEWRALEAALEENGPPRKQALADALLFRAYRQSVFPKAAEEERALEMNEGLAEYTGVKLSSRSISEMTVLAARGLREARERASLARSFAYVTGPAYGALLDSTGIEWRSQLKTVRDFAALSRAAYQVGSATPSAEQALARARIYHGDYVIATETERDKIFRERVAKCRASFLTGPVLILPVVKTFNYSFDPNQTLPLDDTKTIYFSSRVTDDWGILDAAGGALFVREGKGRVQVPAPTKLTGSPLQGDGWTLTLEKGWVLAPGERAGDYVLKQENGQP